MSKKTSSVPSNVSIKNKNTIKSLLAKEKVHMVNMNSVIRQPKHNHVHKSRFSIRIDSITPTVQERISNTRSTESSSKSRLTVENLKAEYEQRYQRKKELMDNIKNQLDQLLNLAENESEHSRSIHDKYLRLETENTRLHEEINSLRDQSREFPHAIMKTRRLMRTNTDLSSVNLKDLNMYKPKKRKSHLVFIPN